jgi:hypothetical protein
LPLPGAIPSGQYVEFLHLVPEYSCISTKLLGIHGAIAEVLHMIGAGEAIDKILREWDSLRVLSEDGMDGELLGGRLQLIAA